MAEELPLQYDPHYSLAVREAARINRVGGITRNEPPVDINVLAIAVGKMAEEIERLRKVEARVVLDPL